MRTSCVFALVMIVAFGCIFGQIVVNEIMYNPAGNNEVEWAELFNYSDTTVFLDSSWSISDGEASFAFGTYAFAAGTYLTVLIDSPDTGDMHITPTFDASDVPSFRLSNSADEIILHHTIGGTTITIDSVHYTESFLPDSLRDTDRSIERKQPHWESNDRNNWAASQVAWGTPNAANSLKIDEIPHLPKMLSINATPNPFNGRCVLDFTAGEFSAVSVFSVDGKMVAHSPIEAHTTTYEFAPQNLPTGVYFAVFNANNTIIQKRIFYIR